MQPSSVKPFLGPVPATATATPSRAHPCAHSVIGRGRCPDRYGDWSACRPPSLDHAELWNVPGGRLLTYQPYDLPDPDKTTAFDTRWGSVTTFRPFDWSWWNPGRTFLVLVAPASGVVHVASALRLVAQSPHRRRSAQSADRTLS